MQNLADRLTALEERMTESKFRAKQAARVQAQSATAITEVKASLMAQLAALDRITRSLAPLANLEA